MQQPPALEPPKKPGCTTFLLAWGAGAFFLARSYWLHRNTGPTADETNQQIAVLMVVICFLLGPIMYALDWSTYKKSLKERGQ